MSLPIEITERITLAVKGGFYNRDQIIEHTVCFCAPDEENSINFWEDFEKEDIVTAVDQIISDHEADKLTWPEITDCDRLNSVFSVLNEVGVATLQDAFCDQADGYSEFKKLFLKSSDRSQIVGYCFYLERDVEGALSGCGLLLVFGPSHTLEEDTMGVEVGIVIAYQLKKAGFKVQWSGKFRDRIHIIGFDWKRR